MNEKIGSWSTMGGGSTAVVLPAAGQYELRSNCADDDLVVAEGGVTLRVGPGEFGVVIDGAEVTISYGRAAKVLELWALEGVT